MSFYSDTLNTFEFLTKKPENFLSVQNDLAGDVKKLLKRLYDHTKDAEGSPSASALPELIIDAFDEEQIWQELELQNEERSDALVRDVALLVAGRRSLSFEPGRDGRESSDDDDDDGGGAGTGDGESEDARVPQDSRKSDRKRKPSKITRKGKPSVVDDRFFKLNELSNFLDRQDRIAELETKKERVSRVESSESDTDDESIDYFQDVPSEDDDEEEEDLWYGDFFDAPEDAESDGSDAGGRKSDEVHSSMENNLEEEADESVDDERSDEDEPKKRVRFESAQSADAGQSDGDGSDGASSGAPEARSSFESRQERLRSRIRELEAKALAEKPWQLKGEVSAVTRPVNSLLEEALEFDLTTRPAPIITEETTLKLEDVIRQRIKDKSWDDVERKVKPVESPFEFKKKLVLNQEKSKLSLAEVYEQEFIKQRESVNPEAEEKPEEEPESHKEIKKMMSALFVKLDALSNFHYTPKPVPPDVQVVSNLPAVTIEEVAPVGVSDAALLAPEEVKAKRKGELVAKEERTETDKKRERRRKKTRQRERRLETEKRKKAVEKLRPGLGNKYSKQKALRALEKASKDKNVSVLEEKTKTVKSSKAFFTQLQEEVVSHIKSKLKGTRKNNNNESNLSAKKIKL
ncbi:U3 small nucleolar ribonucleoprotein protein MPP10 [Bacillus rossius redtenbacheri]|uniref:U3 small nucleolar ribonucleoprotein protein MPP10 n=1 Tax=Bacillus rossius redtenbacheri TaxID=93214 RepID=UPI002FDD6133